MLVPCIDICMATMTMYITLTEASEAYFVRINKLEREDENDVSALSHNTLGRHETKEDALKHIHMKQIFDLSAWHIGVVNGK